MEEKLIEKIDDVFREVREFILSEKDWVFYFANPILDGGANQPLYDLIREYPTEFRDMVDLKVKHIERGLVRVTIEIDADESLNRWINLSMFRHTVAKNKLLYEKGLVKYEIEEVEKRILELKDALKKSEDRLETLRSKEVQTDAN